METDISFLLEWPCTQWQGVPAAPN